MTRVMKKSDSCNKGVVEGSQIVKACMGELTCHWQGRDTGDRPSLTTQETVAEVGAAHPDDPCRGTFPM